jgi:hypothetical protein
MPFSQLPLSQKRVQHGSSSHGCLLDHRKRSALEGPALTASSWPAQSPGAAVRSPGKPLKGGARLDKRHASPHRRGVSQSGRPGGRGRSPAAEPAPPRKGWFQPETSSDQYEGFVELSLSLIESWLTWGSSSLSTKGLKSIQKSAQRTCTN